MNWHLDKHTLDKFSVLFVGGLEHSPQIKTRLPPPGPGVLYKHTTSLEDRKLGGDAGKKLKIKTILPTFCITAECHIKFITRKNKVLVKVTEVSLPPVSKHFTADAVRNSK